MDRHEAMLRWIEQTHDAQRELGRTLTSPSELELAWADHVPEVESYYDFHRPPLVHQLEAHYRFRDQPYHALFWQQRARKTSVELNIFRYRYERGDVDMLLVIAHPSGVHRVWIDELPKDLPPEFMAHMRTLVWQSGKTTAGRRREEALALRDHAGPIV